MRKYILILFLEAIFLSGCAGVPIRKNTYFDNYFSSPREVAIMPIDFKAYKWTAGGLREEMDEWEMQTKNLLLNLVKQKLESFLNIKVSIIESNVAPELKRFLNEQNGLYRAVAQSIITHTYAPVATFPQKLKYFDYTLGSEINQMNSLSTADSLLFLSGSRTYWTGGKIAVSALSMIAAAAVGISVVPVGIPDWLAVSLVDTKTGDIIWFKYYGQPNASVGDLREPGVVAATVDSLLKDLSAQK